MWLWCHLQYVFRNVCETEHCIFSVLKTQEAKYIESWPNTTVLGKFDIPMDRPDGVHALLICTSSTLGSPTCHQASRLQDNTY
jgi:hypothetical protein